MWRKLALTVLVGPMLILLTTRLHLKAQTMQGSGDIGGTVIDPAGAIVPGADVTLTDLARMLDRKSTTNDAGRFLFPSIPPGAYALRVSKAGFQAENVNSLQLDVGQSIALNLTLKIGSTSTSVTVSAGDTALLQTESNTLGTVVGSTRVAELPLNGRNFLQLSLLAAGATNPGAADPQNQTGRTDNEVIIGGHYSYYTGYLVNGIVLRNTRSTELTAEISPAAIDQFKVQESFFMPDQGPNPSLINVTTKGGGNAFHGEAFEFLRNSALDANNYFSPGPETLHRNQFGGAIGGPILKDRLWFFGNGEATRQITHLTTSAFTPIAAMFQGNFSAVPRTIYDPNSFSTVTGTRTAFPGNIIPSNRINPVSQKLLQYYLPGSSLGVTQNLFEFPASSLDDDQFGVRIDASLTPKQTLFGQVFRVNSNLVNASIFPLAGSSYPINTLLGMIQHTYTIRNNLVLTVRVGAVRSLTYFINQGSSAGPTSSDLGIPNRLGDRGITSISFSDYTTFGNPNAGVGNNDNIYQLDGELNYIHGNHNMQFGVGVRYYRTWQQNSNANGLGGLTFQRTFTAQLQPNGNGGLSPIPNTGDTFADFLLGVPTTGTLTGLPAIQYRITQAMPFAQDNWKVTRHFTLNYGLSWFKSTQPNPQGQYNTWPHGFDYATGLLTYAALGQISSEVVKPDNLDFTPRFGFAWQPDFLPHTVIRSGFGLYYADLQLGVLQFAVLAPPYSNAYTLTNSEPVAQNVLGQNIFPPFVRSTPTPDTAASLNNVGAFQLDPNAHYPYMYQWNLSVQQALGEKDVLELTYMGASDHRIESRHDVDQCQPGSSLFCNPATRPYSRYTNLLTIGNFGNSSYNALMARLEHRLSGGLDARLEYTWAKGLSNNSDNGDPQISSCIKCEHGPAGFDVRNRAVLSAIYDLPVGRGRQYGSNMSKALDLAVGGWTGTTIATFQSGLVFNVTQPIVTGSPYSGQRPNRVCNGTNSALAGNLRSNGHVQFQTSCFVAAPTGYFGDSGYNILYGPGIDNWDIGIHKYFSITEDIKLQFRTEMFNAFNHAQFMNPTGLITSPAFGKVTAANPPRNIQFALRFLF